MPSLADRLARDARLGTKGFLIQALKELDPPQGTPDPYPYARSSNLFVGLFTMRFHAPQSVVLCWL